MTSMINLVFPLYICISIIFAMYNLVTNLIHNVIIPIKFCQNVHVSMRLIIFIY